MDPEAFLDVANQVTKLKMYPYFDLAHSAVCLVAIREEMGAGEFTGNVNSKALGNFEVFSFSYYVKFGNFCG